MCQICGNPDAIHDAIDPGGDVAMAGSTSVSPTGNQYIDGLLRGLKWNGPVTYSFPTSIANYEPGYGDLNALINGFAGLNAAQIQAVRDVMAGALGGTPEFSYGSYSSLINLGITEAASPPFSVHTADIRLAQSAYPSTAYAYYPSNAGTGGDVFFGTTSGAYVNPQPGTYAWHTVIHELGHSLGLKHGQETTFFGAVPADRDSMEFTVMTYRSYVGHPLGGYTNETYGYAQTPMMYDIAALQYLYGADFTTHAENSVYTWNPATGEMSINGIGQGRPGGAAAPAQANRIFLTIWDGGGDDTYDMSNYGGGVNIDLRPGGWSITAAGQLAKLDNFLGTNTYARGNVFNALLYQGDARSYIENAIGGGGNDTLAGNAAANSLSGGGGNDRLTGDDGNDVLNGGAGADTLDGGAGAADTLSYAASLLAVTVNLIAGTGAGGDAAGDTYVAGSFEVIAGSNGDDLIFSDGTSQFLFGNDGLDSLYGYGGADFLIGGVGNDALDGGTGADFIDGEAGADIADYRESESGVSVDLVAGSGIGGDAGGDTLNSIEVLFGSAFSDALTGQAAANTALVGADGADTLIGGNAVDELRGGLAGDFLSGAAGDDIIFGDEGGDTIAGGDGFDYVFAGDGADQVDVGETASVNVAFGEAGADTMTGGTGIDILLGGADGDQLAGNGGEDYLFGGAGDDQLDGGDANDRLEGGAGADTITAGGGIDYLLGGDTGIADTDGDRFVFLGGSGTDGIGDFDLPVDVIAIQSGINGTGITSAAAALAAVTYLDGSAFVILDGLAFGASTQYVQLVGIVPGALTAANFIIV